MSEVQKHRKSGKAKGQENEPPIVNKTKKQDGKGIVQQSPILVAGQEISAIVVNLDRRPDRWERCQKQFGKMAPWLTFERFSATNGSKVPIPSTEVALQWNTTRNQRYVKLSQGSGYQAGIVLDLSPGERGCAHSHIQAWRRCSESDLPLMVLEDDAKMTPKFTERLSKAIEDLPDDADVLYMGYCKAAPFRRSINKVLAEAEYVWTTVGYIIVPKAAKKLLSKLPVDQPVDNFMAWNCSQGFIKSYCVKPVIVNQAGGWNEDSDIRHSDEAAWK